MSAAVRADRWLEAATWRNLFRDRPLIPLAGLLLVLVVAVQVAAPGTVSIHWFGVILRQSVPLAILGGCQTLAMLTGGIDLSVAAVASMAGFVTATFVHSPGGWVEGIAVALAAAALAGLITGIGVGVFRVHPLIMTLAMSFVVLGFSNVWQLQMVQTGAGVPTELRWVGSNLLWDVIPYSLLIFVPLTSPDPAGPADVPATAGCCSPSATTRSPRACRAPGPGRC